MRRGTKDQKKSTKPASTSVRRNGQTEADISAKGDELFRKLLGLRNLPISRDEPEDPATP